MTYDEYYATPEGKLDIDTWREQQHAVLDTVCQIEGLSRDEFSALTAGDRMRLVIKHMKRKVASH